MLLKMSLSRIICGRLRQRLEMEFNVRISILFRSKEIQVVSASFLTSRVKFLNTDLSPV